MKITPLKRLFEQEVPIHNGSGNIYVYRTGDMVYMNISQLRLEGLLFSDIICTIPQGYRPSRTLFSTPVTNREALKSVTTLDISLSGSVTCLGDRLAGRHYAGLSWVTMDPPPYSLESLRLCTVSLVWGRGETHENRTGLGVHSAKCGVDGRSLRQRHGRARNATRQSDTQRWGKLNPHDAATTYATGKSLNIHIRPHNEYRRVGSRLNMAHLKCAGSQRDRNGGSRVLRRVHLHDLATAGGAA